MYIQILLPTELLLDWKIFSVYNIWAIWNHAHSNNIHIWTRSLCQKKSISGVTLYHLTRIVFNSSSFWVLSFLRNVKNINDIHTAFIMSMYINNNTAAHFVKKVGENNKNKLSVPYDRQPMNWLTHEFSSFWNYHIFHYLLGNYQIQNYRIICWT